MFHTANQYSNYYTFMQDTKKHQIFKEAVGEVFRDIRKTKSGISLNKFALEYDLDKSNVSKTERGLINIYLITAWKISEAHGIKFSDFAKMLEEKLGKDFTFIDE